MRSTFPDITVCLNSMHSKQKILSKYPFLMEALPFYYGQVNQHDLEKNSLDWDKLGRLFNEINPRAYFLRVWSTNQSPLISSESVLSPL